MVKDLCQRLMVTRIRKSGGSVENGKGGELRRKWWFCYCASQSPISVGGERTTPLLAINKGLKPWYQISHT